MSKKKDWTIMVYMAGDNNLSEEMITALVGMQNAMKAPKSSEKVNIVAVYDSGYPTVQTKHYDFTNATTNGTLRDCETPYEHPQIRRKKDDGDDANEKNHIIDFVQWGVKNRKAKNYALILTGHSDGIIGKTMFRDSNPVTHLNLSKLSRILVKSAKTLGQKEKFAFIGFDSCLMNMAEVGYELRNIADVMVASEGDVPVSGWSYFDVFSEAVKKINEDVKFSGKDFAKIFVDKFIDFSQNYNVGGRSVSISACDLNEAENLRNSINNLAKLFNRLINLPFKEDAANTSEPEILLFEKVKSLIHNSHYYSQTVMFEQAVDVLDFVQTLSSDCDFAVKEVNFLSSGEKHPRPAVKNFVNYFGSIKDACSKIESAIDKYVLANGSSGAAYQFSSGVSVFFPWTLIGLYVIYTSYGKLSFSDNYKGDWFEFIEKYNLLTYRGIGEPSSKKDFDYFEWWKEMVTEMNADTDQEGDTDVGGKNVGGKNVGGKNVGGKNVGGKNVGGKNVGGKNVGGKNVGGKNVGAKNIEERTERDGFYSLFERFRNHPIEHDIVLKNIK